MNSNLSIFHRRVKRCIEKLTSFKKYIYGYNSDQDFAYVDWHKSIIDEIEEAIALITQYNLLNNEGLIKVKLVDKDENISSSSLEEVAVHLNSILREIQDVDSYLNNYLMPNLSESEKNKIESLNDELEEFEKFDIEEIIIKNLKESLQEAESKHHLACSIISARIISYILEKFDGKLDEEKLSNLVKLNVIKNDEKSKETSKFFLDAAKSSRNAVSHKIDYFPSGSDALSVLSYAFRMTHLFIKYKKIKNGTTNQN